MIYSSKFIAVLDACVLYPMPIRDFLLHLAAFELYKPKWTAQIQEEWRKNLLINRPDLSRKQLERTTKEMDKAFPDATVENYQALIPALKLPDPDDRHVLAAAIRSQAAVIVTTNLKDFPDICLKQFDLEAQHPDQFISNLIDMNPEKALQAFQQQVAYLKNPPLTVGQVLGIFKKVGLKDVSDKISGLLNT